MNKIGVLLISMLSFGSLMGQSVGMEIKPVRVPSNHEAANTASSMEYGYCGDMYTTIGWPNMEVRMRASIQIPTEIAERFSGVEISKVLVGIGDAETKDAQIFITQSLQNTEHIYVQDVNLEPSVWNEITLDEPYTIDGDEIFIGYELTAGGVGVQNYHAIAVDNENPNKYGDYIGTYSEGEWSDIHLSEVNLGNVCIKLVLTGDNLPQYDMELQSLTVKEYMRTGEEFSISGVVKNFGAKDIGSYNVECQIDQQEPMLFTVSDEVKSNSINQFEIDGLTISEDGVHELRITVVSLDGNEDEYPANNSLTESVTCMSNLANRKVLLEQFSTMSCSNCPAAHTVIDKILSERDDVAWVVHHAGYNYDTYTIDASRKYTAFYNSPGTYAPAMMLDRTNLSEQGAIGSGNEPAPGPVFALSGEAQITRFIDYCASQPAYISLNIYDVYDAESDEVSIKVSGESLVDIGKDIYLNIFLTESGMINNQAGADNNYVHNHAIRANVTSTWGDVINLNADGSFEATYLYSLKSAWVPENMEVIAFVSDFNSTDANDCKVYNTEFKKLNVNTSVEGVASDGLKVWTSGRTLCIGGEYASAEIYNMSGLLVKSVRGDRFVDISQSGVYIVKIDGEVYKLVIR